MRLLTYGPDSLLDRLLAATGVSPNTGSEFTVDGAPVHRLDELEAQLAESGPAPTIAEQVGEFPFGDKL